jgi:branched-subunit amino acid transport protein
MSDVAYLSMSDAAYLYSAILLLALCVVLCRTGYLVFGRYFPLPPKLRSALRYAPLAALVAIIVPDVLPWSAQTGPQFDLRVLAVGVSVLVFLATRNGLLVILSGMFALWSLRGLLLLF